MTLAVPCPKNCSPPSPLELLFNTMSCAVMVAAGLRNCHRDRGISDHDIHEVGGIHRFGLIPWPHRSGDGIADQNDVLAGDRARLARDRIDEERHPFRDRLRLGAKIRQINIGIELFDPVAGFDRDFLVEWTADQIQE